MNRLLLPPGGEYATAKQIFNHGGRIKKGSESYVVIFWKWIENKADSDNNKIDNSKNKNKDRNEAANKIPLLRYYRIFEINTQVEGLQSKQVKK